MVPSFVPDHQRTDWVNRVAKSLLGGDLFQETDRKRTLDGHKPEQLEFHRAVFVHFLLLVRLGREFRTILLQQIWHVKQTIVYTCEQK